MRLQCIHSQFICSQIFHRQAFISRFFNSYFRMRFFRWWKFSNAHCLPEWSSDKIVRTLWPFSMVKSTFYRYISSRSKLIKSTANFKGFIQQTSTFYLKISSSSMIEVIEVVKMYIKHNSTIILNQTNNFSSNCCLQLK